MIKRAILILSMFSSLDSFAQKPSLEIKVNETDSSRVFIYKENGEVVKIHRYSKDGLRDGLSELWNRDPLEWSRHTFFYENGVLLESTSLGYDGSILTRRIFRDGRELEYTNLSTVQTNEGLPIYFKVVYNKPCGFMQYRIVGNTVVDSIYVPTGR